MNPLRDSILFVCEGNMMRSQMAEAFYNEAVGSQEALSAGAVAESKDHISPRAIDAMNEIGIDVTACKPAQLTPEMAEIAETIIYFPSDFMPNYVKNNSKAKLWDVVDPHYHKEQGMELVRSVRDDIKSRVDKLIEEMQ